MTKLPKDENGQWIPALKFGEGSHAVAFTTTAAKNNAAISADTQIVSLYATEDCYIKFSKNAELATSSDHFFPARVYYDVHIGKDTSHTPYISALQVTTGGTLYISEKK